MPYRCLLDCLSRAAHMRAARRITTCLLLSPPPCTRFFATICYALRAAHRAFWMLPVSAPLHHLAFSSIRRLPQDGHCTFLLRTAHNTALFCAPRSRCCASCAAAPAPQHACAHSAACRWVFAPQHTAFLARLLPHWFINACRGMLPAAAWQHCGLLPLFMLRIRARQVNALTPPALNHYCAPAAACCCSATPLPAAFLRNCASAISLPACTCLSFGFYAS